jgi:hypothetical protein
MTFLIVLGLYTAALFCLGFLSRRSMGVPALALTAGAVLAKLWTDSLTPLVAESGVVIIQPPLESLVAIALTLIPALLVMIRSHKAKALHHSLLGSFIFAVLGVMLTYGAFANAVVLDEASEQYVRTLLSYENVIITVAIVAALLEVVFYRKPHSSDRYKK